MKKIITACLIASGATNAISQPASTLQENFDASCALAAGHPADWIIYNPLQGTVPAGGWSCAPENGRPNPTGASTPGVMCTSVYGTPPAYNLDTSYLITPLLNLSSYAPGQVYLHFDSKVSKISLGGKYHIVTAPYADTLFHNASDSDVTAAVTPLIGPGDSSDWVTHEINISEYEYHQDFYLAFRYTGSTATGSAWYLDNINISTTRLYTPEIVPGRMPLTVVGQSTGSQVIIAYNCNDNIGTYSLGIFDMLGREVYKESLNVTSGVVRHVINDLNLNLGVYLIKMGNGRNFGVAKAMVN